MGKIGGWQKNKKDAFGLHAGFWDVYNYKRDDDPERPVYPQTEEHTRNRNMMKWPIKRIVENTTSAKTTKEETKSQQEKKQNGEISLSFNSNLKGSRDATA